MYYIRKERDFLYFQLEWESRVKLGYYKVESLFLLSVVEQYIILNVS